MRPYDSLTTPGQVRRLRALAVSALPAFGLSAKRPITLLNHGENTTFRVDAPRGRTRVLRVHRPDYQTAARIRSECAWLTALASDTDIPVPAPIHGVDDDAVQRIVHPGVPQPHLVTLLTWVPGSFRITAGGIRAHERLGRLSAALHRHAASWRRPRGFRRLRWDVEGLCGPSACWGDPLGSRHLSKAQRRIAEQARDEVTRILAAYGTGRQRFGLIHADLHPGNVVVQDGRACPIDFDDCGPGWFMYDMAVSLLPSRTHPRFERAFAAYVEGYRTVRPLEEADLATFNAFALARRLAMVGWLTKREDNPRLGQYIPLALKRLTYLARAFLDTGRIPSGRPDPA